MYSVFGPSWFKVNDKSLVKAPPGTTVKLTWAEVAGSDRYTVKYGLSKTSYDTYVAGNTTECELDFTLPNSEGLDIYFGVYGWIQGNTTYYSYDHPIVQIRTITPASTPELSISNISALPGGTALLSWPECTPGNNSEITGYQIYSSDGSTTAYDIVSADTFSVQVTASSTAGKTMYYQVRAIAEYTEGYSAWSNPVSLWSILPPAAATLNPGGLTYSPYPRILATIGTGEAPLSISAPNSVASRSTGLDNGNKVVLRRTQNQRSENNSYTFNVTVTDAYGISTDAQFTITCRAPVWTDDPIVAGETVIKAAHINELRSALNAVCDYYGIARTSWAEAVVAGTTPSYNWAAHVTEIQNTIRRIVTYINAFDPESSVNNISLPSMPEPRNASADIINQLRELITIL